MRNREAERFYREASSIYENLFGENHPETVSAYMALAELYEKQNKFTQAEALYRKARPVLSRILGEKEMEK